MECTNCHKSPVIARDVCKGCYDRLRRRGTLERKNVRNTGQCAVEGCDKPSFAKNLCTIHYERAQHPLNHSWRLLRSRHPGQYPAPWDRFDAFLADVGERPHPKSQLRRNDVDTPWSKDNIYWTTPVNPGRDSYTPEQRSDYAREHNLVTKFGITGTQRAGLMAAQGGVCAICLRPPSRIRPKTGKLIDLAVDHDHATGVIRGILCTDCNTSLGLMDDSPVRLRAAATYLDRHQVKDFMCEEVAPETCTTLPESL